MILNSCLFQWYVIKTCPSLDVQSFIPLLHVSLQSVLLRTGFDSSNEINRAPLLLKKLIIKLPDPYLCQTELFLFQSFFKAAVFLEEQSFVECICILCFFFCGKNSKPTKAVQVLAFTSALDCELSSVSGQEHSTWTVRTTAGDVDWHFESI